MLLVYLRYRPSWLLPIYYDWLSRVLGAVMLLWFVAMVADQWASASPVFRALLLSVFIVVRLISIVALLYLERVNPDQDDNATA